MKNCECCGQIPCARPVELERCGICQEPHSRYKLEWMGKPNPYGADRGVVFSHWECKDTAKCHDKAFANASA